MLIVDDEERILLAVGDYFDFHDHAVACARDLCEAKALIARCHYDVVIADLRLTGIDGSEGLELVTYIREKSTVTKIVLLTAYGNDEIMAEAYRRGADAFLAKPQPLADIAQLVRSLLIGPPNQGESQPMLRKIVVVDDSELLHRMYDLILLRYRHAGTVVLHARNGAEGMTVIHEHRDVDLVLLDINMPVMNGLEMLEALKRSGRLAGMTVIMVSTEGHEEDVKRAVRNGATAYVTKPFTPSLLYDLVAKHLLPSPRVAIQAGS